MLAQAPNDMPRRDVVIFDQEKFHVLYLRGFSALVAGGRLEEAFRGAFAMRAAPVRNRPDRSC
jgi:hypothetical protein